MTQINDIITDEIGSVYADTAIWCNENGAVLEEIESKNGKRRFQVKAIPEPTIEEKQFKVRAIRNEYLANSDKYVLPDYPISDEQRQKWYRYRQYLRDYTTQDNWWESNPKIFEKFEA